MNKDVGTSLLNKLTYDLTDAVYHFHLEPNEDTKQIELSIEFSFADVDQVFDATDMNDFSLGQKIIALPVRTVVYFVEERGADEYSPFCEGQFIGLLVFSNTDEVQISLEEFQDFINNHNHELSVKVWKKIRGVFELYIEEKNFPDLPVSFEKQEN